MKLASLLAVAVSMLVAVGVGWLLRGPGDTRDRIVSATTTGERESPRIEEPRALDRNLDDLTRRVAALEDELRAARAEDAARWARLEANVDAVRRLATDTAVRTGARSALVPEDPAALEKLRDRWKARLDETEKRLWEIHPNGPDDRDIAAWSRFDDLKKARAAFDRARDRAGLQALLEGEFKSYFTER